MVHRRINPGEVTAWFSWYRHVLTRQERAGLYRLIKGGRWAVAMAAINFLSWVKWRADITRQAEGA